MSGRGASGRLACQGRRESEDTDVHFVDADLALALFRYALVLDLYDVALFLRLVKFCTLLVLLLKVEVVRFDATRPRRGREAGSEPRSRPVTDSETFGDERVGSPRVCREGPWKGRTGEGPAVPKTEDGRGRPVPRLLCPGPLAVGCVRPAVRT